MSSQLHYSRLEKKNRQRQWHQTWLWLGLTILLVTGAIFIGIPALVKLAGWWGDVSGGAASSATEDTLPPAPPRLAIPWTATNSATLDLVGYAEPGSQVEVFTNDKSAKIVTADASGQFLANSLPLEDGQNRISAKAKDQANNQSGSSSTESVTYDHQPPKLTIEKPQEGSQYFGSSQKKIEVIGETEPGAEVLVNNRSMVVDQKGKFSTIIQLNDGEQTISAIARDAAGNETKQEIKVTYSP